MSQPQRKDLPGQITGLVAILAVAAFVLLGFFTGGWKFDWIVFLAIPVTGVVTDIIFKKKDVAGTIVGLVAILAAVAYFVLGFLLDLWHPGWLVFLAIPLTAIVVDIIKKSKDAGNVITGLITILAILAYLCMGFFLNLWHIAWVVFLLIPITAIISNIIKPAPKAPDEEKKDQ